MNTAPKIITRKKLSVSARMAHVVATYLDELEDSELSHLMSEVSKEFVHRASLKTEARK